MQSNDGLCQWFFGLSNDENTIGVLVMKPGGSLPPHSRPESFESNVQVQGECEITLFDSEDASKKQKIILHHGKQVRIKKGQIHSHANNSQNISVTLFKHDGDISHIMCETRKTLQQLAIEDIQTV